MCTVRRYAKAIIKKLFAAVLLILLSIVNPVFSVVLVLCRVLAIPFTILSVLNGGILFLNGIPGEALLSLSLAAAAMFLYFTLPMVKNALTAAIAHLKYLIRRPLVYKSRLTYTFG